MPAAKPLAFLLALHFLPACAADNPQAPFELVFQTGFEGTSRVEPLRDGRGLVSGGYDIDRIVGKDTTLDRKSDWFEDMEHNPDAGNFMLEYTGGNARQRQARIVPEQGNPNNHVLQFWLKEPWAASEGQTKARVQSSLYGIRTGYKEMLYTVRVFLHPEFKTLENYPGKIGWLTIGEYWNNEWWRPEQPYGFRITLGIGKDSAGPEPLHFILNAENAGQKEVWRGNNTEVKAPIGQWFTLECYFREGDRANGRFRVAITPDGGKRTVVFDIHDVTYNLRDPAPDGMTGFNPMKLYTSKEVVNYVNAHGQALQIDWDDFKLWKGPAGNGPRTE